MDVEQPKREHVVVASSADMIQEGLRVMDVNGVKIGAVRRYDLEAGYMVVESGAFSPVYHVVPFSAIGSVNRDTQSVHLTVQGGALQKTHGFVGDW
jgi:hypothetical protein